MTRKLGTRHGTHSAVSADPEQIMISAVALSPLSFAGPQLRAVPQARAGEVNMVKQFESNVQWGLVNQWDRASDATGVVRAPNDRIRKESSRHHARDGPCRATVSPPHTSPGLRPHRHVTLS